MAQTEPTSKHKVAHPGGTSDSAGVPWVGRTFTASGFEQDDGSANVAVTQTLRAVASLEPGRERSEALKALVEALLADRLLVPVVARETEKGGAVVSPTGIDIQPDRSAEVAMVSLNGPDGRPSLPVFSCVQTMRSWNAQARPIPVDTRKAMLSAVSEGCQTVWVDPGSQYQVLLPRPAVWAAAQGQPWVPFLADAEARAEVKDMVLSIPQVHGVHFSGAAAAEVHLVCGLRDSFSAPELSALGDAVGQAVARCETASHIDSLQVSFARM